MVRLIFNDNPVHQVALQKHLGMFLDWKLSFEEHLKTVFNKVNKNIGLLRKFQNFSPSKSLLKVRKFFIRTHLDYGDIIYGQRYAFFHQRLESLQYNSALVVAGATRGTWKKHFIMNQAIHFKIDDGIENYPFFTKLSLTNPLLLNVIPRDNTTHSTRGSNIPLLALNTIFPKQLLSVSY